MSRKLSAKPLITIVGAGNLAGALTVSLHGAGYRIDQIVSRTGAASLQRARRLAREVGASVVATDRAQIRAEVVWFCVPDGAIARAAKSLAGAADWNGKVALHSSGALTSDELAVLRETGAAVASVHPSHDFCARIAAVVCGSSIRSRRKSRAARAARAIVLDLRGQAFTIRKPQKATYHAWGMFASPLLTALLAASERVAVAAGVGRNAASQRMLPILRQTLANYARLGAPGSFSGPIARGDVATVAKHLRVLRGVPGSREIYVALARAALRDLPAKNRAALDKILKA